MPDEPTYTDDIIGASQRAELRRTQRELDELLASHPGVSAMVSVTPFGVRRWRVEVHRGERCIASADREEPGELRAIVERALSSADGEQQKGGD